jgi:hypothetical protein
MPAPTFLTRYREIVSYILRPDFEPSDFTLRVQSLVGFHLVDSVRFAAQFSYPLYRIANLSLEHSAYFLAELFAALGHRQNRTSYFLKSAFFFGSIGKTSQLHTNMSKYINESLGQGDPAHAKRRMLRTIAEIETNHNVFYFAGLAQFYNILSTMFNDMAYHFKAARYYAALKDFTSLRAHLRDVFRINPAALIHEVEKDVEFTVSNFAFFLEGRAILADHSLQPKARLRHLLKAKELSDQFFSQTPQTFFPAAHQPPSYRDSIARCEPPPAYIKPPSYQDSRQCDDVPMAESYVRP